MGLTLERPIVFRAAGLLLGGALAGFGGHVLRPSSLSLASFEPPTACHGPEEAAAPDFIEPEEASSYCGMADVAFADARPAPQYADGHVADALHIPCEGSASVAPAVGRRLDGARLVIVYGQTSEEGSALAESLRRVRPSLKVRALRGGFSAWEARGFACAAGPCVECMASGAVP